MFSVFLCICSRLLDHVFSLFYFPYLLNSSYFYYKYGTIQHAIYTIHNHKYIHKHTHIHIHIHILLFFEDSSGEGLCGTCDFSTKTKTAAFLSVSSGFHSTQHTAHSTQHTAQHTHTAQHPHTTPTHTHAHLKGKVRGISGEGSFRKWRKTNRTIW